MPILAVDQMGRIYQTSGDRADGLGFGHYPECEGQSDTTLGAAYLKSQRRQQQELLNRKRNQQLLDQRERAMGAERKRVGRKARHQALAQHRMMQNPDVKRAVLKQGLQMGACSCEYNGPFGGNVMTANGLRGFSGMGRDQQVIHTEVLGMGRAKAHPVDPTLVRNQQGREQADRFLRIKAIPAKRTGPTRL